MHVGLFASCTDQGYVRGDTPMFTTEFSRLARSSLYLTEENNSGGIFGAAYLIIRLRIHIAKLEQHEPLRLQEEQGDHLCE